MVVAPGTGLGQGFLLWNGNGYQAYPSEGGHADFAPTDAVETGLLLNLWEKYDRVSYERVCSGSGLPDIYAYLRDSGHVGESGWIREQLADPGNDPAAVIVSGALDSDRSCLLCQAALNRFVAILGAKAGNATLEVMASAGVYLAGGMPPRILPALKSGTFMDAFKNKGRMSSFMAEIPVQVILNPKAALLGAACHAMALKE